MAIDERQSFDIPDAFRPDPNYDPFKALERLQEKQEREKNVKYDLSKIEELYGGLGVGDYADAFVGGFTDAVAATAEGLAGITGNQALTNRVARYRDHMDDAITGDVPDELKQKFSYKAVNAIGAMPAYVAMAYGTRGISLALKGLSWLGLGGNAYQQGRDDYISTIGAEGRDLTEEEFRASNSVGAKTMLPLMILERTGANTLVNSLFKGTGGTTTVGNVLKRFSKAPLAEGLTEGTQTLYQNYLANELASYDPDRPINQGVVESMLLGAIASGTYSTPANAVQMQVERLAENFDQNNINATEMADELGRSLLGAAIDDGAIPPTGADERKIIHSRGAVTRFVDDILTPLTSKLSKAGPQYKRAFRDFERQTGVQQGKAREVIEPFIQRMRNLKKISEEDYDTISDALANISIINKGNQVELDAVDSPQANEEVSTPELKENDSFVLDPTMPVGTRATETIVIDGVKTERKTRGLTEEESQGGLDAAVITEKVNKIQEQAKNAKLALSQTVPDLDIKVYHSQQEFQEATGADGDAVKGAYKDGVISVNATLATENTVAHEVLHAAFLSDGKTGQEARDTAAGLLQSIARGSKDEKLVAYSKRFAESYDPSIQSEETLAEMFGVMSATYTSLDVNAKTKIKAFLAQVADAFGVTGLFTEATTDKQVIDAFNTLSSSVANGTVTPEGIRIFRGSGMVGTEGSQAQQRFQSNYIDPETKVRYTYFKNDEQYQRLIDNGQITKDRSIFDFDGVPMSMHVPDAMFTGQIDYKGNTIAEGRGGLNYTARFNDDNAFWASTENAANGMVKDLNNQLLEPNSDGKIRMMLLSTNLDKSTSSVDGAINSTKILGTIQNLVKSENKQEAEQVFVRAIKMAALQTEKGKQGKLNGLKQGNLFKNVKNAKQAVSVLENYLDERNTSFDDRRSFVKFLAQRIGDQIGYTKDSVGNREFKEDYQRAMQDLLFKSSKMNQYSDIFNLGKGKTPSASSPATSMVEGLSYMLGEPLIRDYALHDQIKRGVPSIPNGSAYAVLEIEGRVKAIELLNEDGTQKHNSYRFAIVSEGNEKAKIHLLRDRVRALEHYDLQGKSADSFLPPSAGFTGANYGFQQINKDKAKKFDEKKIMDPLVGRGADITFPQDMRQQKRSNETHEQALARMLSKYNMQKDFDGVRTLLNYLYTSGREAGMDVSYMEQYFPRLVKDLVGLQDEYKGVYYDNEIERELDLYAKKKFGGRELDPLERQVFLENLAKNKILKRGGAGGVTQNAVNERKIAVLDTDIRKKYYESAEASLETYVDSMIASINQMKLIGTARKERGQRVQSGLLGRMMDADLQQGTLTAEGLNIIQDAVDARFGMNGQQHGFIRGAKNAGYIATMGNIGSAITQLGDFYFSAVQNGLVNTVQAGLAKKELNRQDVMGMKNLVTIEAQEGAKSLQKAVDFVFKASGITAIDGLAKDTNINAALRDMRKRASQSPNSRAFQKLQKELSVYQGRDSAQTIADIRNGVNSDLVLEAIYNRLSNVAPISLSEMPEAYNRNPNARIIYSLKSYTIKQFDFIRNESFNKMGSSKTFAEGFTNLLRIATLAMAANGSADVLKAILFNREIDEEDLIWNNILRMFGITKFTTVKARQEGLGEAFLKTVAPPQFGILDDFSKDFDQAITEGSFDIDELRSVKYIPFVGKLYYWREGRGKDVEKRLSRLRD